MVADALSRKKRFKPKRVCAMNMNIQSSINDKLLAAQNEAFEVVNAPAEMLRGLDDQMERRSDGALYNLDQIWVPLAGEVRNLIIDEAHKSKYTVHPGADKMYDDLRDMYWWPRIKKDITLYRIAIDFITKLSRTGSGHDAIWVIVDRLTKSSHFLPIHEDFKIDRACVMDFVGSWDVHLPLAEFSYTNIYHSSVRCAPFKALYDWLKIARDHQKSYADKRRKPLEFNVGDHVLLKVSPWKGVVRFEKKCKFTPRFIPLEEIQVDAKLNFVEELVEILEREFKKLKRSRIDIVKSDTLKYFTMTNEDPSSVNTQQHCGRYQDYQDKDFQRRLLASYQDDPKYEHVSQDTRLKDGKDLKEKDLKILELKTKSKDNDKGSRSKITRHEGTSLQQR
ncbi:putative reverse transcriptase domain-containing protein [Tanacetum coccineum]